MLYLNDPKSIRELFKKLKKKYLLMKFLIPNNPSFLVVVATDASAYGLEAVISFACEWRTYYIQDCGFYNDIMYWETKNHGVVADIADIFEIGQIESILITAKDLARIFKTDFEPLCEKLLSGDSIIGLGFPGEDGGYSSQKRESFYIEF
ncbi:hypothetical protein AVEN_24690-1, partial [Araneus ventricosus]|uniref:Uncharacterized protein n=1 Tax=Araneus ventricosus TaxID=182803 RepID=A0A4Y2SWD0_ARAVE